MFTNPGSDCLMPKDTEGMRQAKDLMRPTFADCVSHVLAVCSLLLHLVIFCELTSVQGLT